MQNLGREGKDKLFNFRPLFFTAAFLCLGVVFSYLRIFHDISLWWLCLLIGLGAPFIFCGKEKLFKTAIAVFVLICAFFLGLNCFAAQMYKYTDVTNYNGVYSVQGRVEEKSVGRWDSVLILSNIAVEGKEEESKLIAYLPTSFCENIELFDVILLRGTLTMNNTELTAETFSAHAVRDGIKYRLSGVESCKVVGYDFQLFGWIRARVENTLYHGMDADPASVTVAVLTGNTYGIESGLLENMRYGGIAHVFAVSGLHVGALFAFCMFLTAKTGLKKAPKLVRFLIVAGVLIFYGGICGFSASVLRAAVLCLVGYAAKLVGTKIDKFEALGGAVILILLLSPVELFAPGFQLSFLACLGIFLWSKPLGKWGNRVCDEIIKRMRAFTERRQRASAVVSVETSNKNGEKPSVTIAQKARKGIVSFLSVSVAAQIATAPVLLQTFGYLSGWSLLLNFLFVPFISAIFSLLLILAALACILPISAAPVILYLPNLLWSAALLLFEAFDFSAFAIKDFTLTAGSFICYYLALSFFSDKWNLTAKQRKWFGLLCAVGFIAVVLIVNI